MRFLREKSGRSLLALITDDCNDEILILVDDVGNEYSYVQCGYKPYNGDFTYCMLKEENQNSAEIFRFEKIGNDLALCPVTDTKKCEALSKDIIEAKKGYEKAAIEKKKNEATFANKAIGNETIVSKTENRDVKVSEERIAPCKAEQLNYIEPKLSKSGKIGIMITLILSYSLLLLVGILLVAVPSFSSAISGLGICKEISARAYAITIGLMWIALTPTIGYYFATLSPLNLNKRAKILIACITTVLLVVTNIVFFVVTNTVKIDDLVPIKEFYETSDVWFIPLNMVFGSIGVALCCMLTLFKLDPSKIKDVKNENSGKGVFEAAKYIFLLIVGLVLKLVKVILKIKEKQPDIFVLVFSILLTWLVFFVAFIFAIIIIAVFVAVLIMLFCGLVEFSGAMKTSKSVYCVYEHGSTLTLNYFDYDSFESRERYKDNLGSYWYKVGSDEFIREGDYKTFKDNSTH